MSLKENIFQIWKAKGQILEGITNSVFKKEDVEKVARDRMNTCKLCPLFDEKGDGCMVPGTQPCCNQNMGGCGCSLAFKTRSLSSDCPKLYWRAVMEQHEEDKLNEKLGL